MLQETAYDPFAARGPDKVPDAPAASNSNELTEAEARSLFFYCVREDLAALAKVKAAQAERKSFRKIIQSYEIALSEIDFAQKAMTADDKGTITDKHTAHDRILFWLGLRSGHQPDLFIDRAPVLERIVKEGERAGWLALARESPYAPGSDETMAWEDGYDTAQAEAAANLASAMLKRNAAKAESDEIIEGGERDDPFADGGGE